MTRKTQNVTKEVDSVNIEFADNGFIINYSGLDDQDKWTNAKIILHKLEEVFEHIETAYNLGR